MKTGDIVYVTDGSNSLTLTRAHRLEHVSGRALQGRPFVVVAAGCALPAACCGHDGIDPERRNDVILQERDHPETLVFTREVFCSPKPRRASCGAGVC